MAELAGPALPTDQGLRFLAATIGRTLVATAALCFTRAVTRASERWGDGQLLWWAVEEGFTVVRQDAWARGVETSDANLDHA
jgi:hypothetical protein